MWNQVAWRDRVGEVDAENAIAATERDHGLIVEGTGVVYQVMVASESAKLIRLAEGVLRVVVVEADDGLIFPAEQILGIGELQAEPDRALG